METRIVRLCTFVVISLLLVCGNVTRASAQSDLTGTWSGTSVWIPPAGPQSPFPISFSLTLWPGNSVSGDMSYYYSGQVSGTWTGANATSAAINLEGSVYGGPDTVTGTLTNGGNQFGGQWEIVNNGSGSPSIANFSTTGTANVESPPNTLTDQELNALNTVLSEAQTSAAGWANAIAAFKSTGNAISSFASFLATEAEEGLGTAISRVAGVFTSFSAAALDPSVAQGVQAVFQAARDPNNPGIINSQERNALNQLDQQDAAAFQTPPPPPVGPTNTVGNTQQFDIPVTAGQPVTVDPLIATGFEYKTGAGNPNFESVILPFLGSFQPDYDIQVFSDGTWVDDGFSYPLQEFLFSQLGGVSDFRVLGISDSADLLLPSDFVSALTFEDTGVFTGTITELTPAENVPEPSSLVELASGLFFLLAYRGHRRMAQRCAASRRAEPRQTLLT
jgi:hypothetical protein